MYVLSLETDHVRYCRYFATAELAYAHDMKQTGAFTIEKYQIAGQDGTELRKIKSYWNPYLMGERTSVKELVEERDGDGWTAELKYTRDGILQNFWSCEIERSDEDELKNSFSRNLFTNAFIYMPNPFEKRDIVRILPDGCRGVVNTSQEDWIFFCIIMMYIKKSVSSKVSREGQDCER